MHQLIRVLTVSVSPDDATAICHHMFGGRNPAFDIYDDGVVMTDESARWRDTMPAAVREQGAIEASSGEGMELIESAWTETMAELKRHLAVVRTAVKECDDEQLLAGPRVDVNVEPYNPMGLDDDNDHRTTFSSNVRRSMCSLGRYQAPCYYLYRDDGEAIRSPGEFEQVCDNIENGVSRWGRELDEEESWWVVPMDVHY